MKILQISTYDFAGGAGRAAYRLHKGLREIGQDCRMLVKHKDTNDDFVFRIAPQDRKENNNQEFFLDVVIQGQYINCHRTDISNTMFSLPYPGYDLSRLSMVREADIINLHWVTQYQSPLTIHSLFSLGKPVVWTLHDQWPFTGGCHYAAGCQKYRKNCEACPQLADDPFGLPGAVLDDNLKLFHEACLTIVTPSRWMGACAKESKLFRNLRVEVIPNSLETDVFFPLPKVKAKESLGLSIDTVTLLFGAEYGTEKRKGLRQLGEAIDFCLRDNAFQRLVKRDKIKMICFGNIGNELSAIGIPVISLGYLKTEEKARTAYSAADVFVQASLEDNFPNTMLEAMSCGTPVVAFDVGGMPDLVKSGATGELAPLGDTKQLGNVILSLIFDSDRRKSMGKECRRQIEKGYGLDVQASGYLKLYEGLISEHKAAGEGRAAGMGYEGSLEMVAGTRAADTSMVTLEFDLAPHFHAIYDKVLFRALKEFAPHAKREWEISDADCAARLQKLNQLTKMLETCEADRAARLDQVKELTKMLETCEADRAARLGQVKELTGVLQKLEAERDETGNKINKLEESLSELARDCSLRFETVSDLKEGIQELRAALTYESRRAQAAEEGWRNLEAEFAVRQARRLGLVKVKRCDSSIASKSDSRKQKKSPKS